MLAGILLMLPSLGAGLAADDFFHALMLRSEPGLGGFEYRPLDIFGFARGDDEQIRALMDEGVYSWWAHPQLKLYFWRPISSLSHALDHLLWPEHPVWMHAHSLLWFAVLLALLARLYQRFEPRPWVAGLALWLYAIDDAHGWTVGWVAHRNALIAAVLSLPALLCYQRWRVHGWQPGLWLGPLFLAAGLAAGESAVAVLGYLVAYAYVLDSGSLTTRLWRLWPYGAVIVSWQGLYSGLGYGAFGSGIYVDPVRDPLRFLKQLGESLPALLHGQLGPIWSDLWLMLPPVAKPRLWALLMMSLVILGALFLPLLRRDRTARFWALGMLLAAVPVCATFPSDRLLIFVGVGGAGLVSCFLGSFLDDTARVGRPSIPSWATALCAAGLVLVHLLLAPLMAPFRSLTAKAVQAPIEAIDTSIPKNEAITRQTLVSVNGPHEMPFAYLPILRQIRGEPRPAAVRSLAQGLRRLTITRTDARTLRITRRGGHFEHPFEHMLRGPGVRLGLGEVVEIRGLSIEVISLTDHGWPSEIEYRFDVDLEDPSLHWVLWDAGGFVPFEVPDIGESVTLPALDMIRVFAGWDS